jgi:hypothetical protein
LGKRLSQKISPIDHSFKHTTLVLLSCPYFKGEKVMHTITRTPTTDMEVTSIRLERELKEKLKEIAGNQGYQALIRDILWNYVQQKSGEWKPRFSRADIRATIAATAQQEERCVLTGQLIQPQQPMLLGLTRNGDMVPLSVESLAG